MKWTRPETVAFPQVWWNFKAKDPETGNIVNYRIEDVAEDRFSEIVDLLNCFVQDEPIGISKDFVNDEVSLGEVRELWRETLPKKLTLVCYKEGSSEICGFNILEVIEESQSSIDELEKFKGKFIRDLFTMVEFLKGRADVYRRYNVDKYLYGLGLLTLPKYRGCGIATELLRARFPFMKALGLSLTCTIFTGPGSQGAAQKAGFTEDLVVSYESMEKESPFIQFPKISWPIVKLMCYQLE